MSGRKRILERLINFYPPLWGAGIRVASHAHDWSSVVIEMKERWWNRNYVGVHYGGSLYSMCDPWFMLILMKQLGDEFVVWDKAASIRFRRPGKGLLRASFHIPSETIAEVKRQTLLNGVYEPTFKVNVIDREGKVVASVEKVLHVTAKRR
jgi:hypothetical protein